MKRISIASAALILSFSVLPACADVVFNQTKDGFTALASETATGDKGLQTEFDDFSLVTADTITTVSWTGWTEVGKTLNGFTISFYQNDSSGAFAVPGALIPSSYLVSLADAHASLLGSSGTGFGIYNYTAAISFAAAAGTTYWVSIVGDPASNNSWNWATSDALGVGANSYQTDNLGAGSQVPTNFAFSLADASTPEPSSLCLLGTGILGLVGVARRKMFV